MVRHLIVYFISIFCLSAAGQAAQRVALVIGNSAYRNATELTNPGNDANDIAAVLKKYGFEVVLGRDLDKVGFEAKIREFAQALKGADAGVFFYAGHGLQVAGQNFLVPVDAKLDDAEGLDFEAIRLDIVQRIMEREAKASVLFLDACRNSPFARSLARSLGNRSADVGQGLAAVESGIGTLISYSTQPGNVALDGKGRNSPFAGALAKEVSRSKEDLGAILIAVRNEVMQETNNKQVPWEHSSLRARFFIAPLPADLPQVQPGPKSAADEAWSLLKDSADAGKIITFRAKYGEKNPQHDQMARRRLEYLVSSASASNDAPNSMTAEAGRALIRDVFKRVRSEYPEPANEAALVARALGKLIDTFPGSLNKTEFEGRLARLTPNDVEGAADLLADVFANVQKIYGRWSDPAILMEGILNPVLRGLDAHTTYFTPERFRAFLATSKGEFGGVGLEVRLENGLLTVVTPRDDTPAAKADLRAGDLILEIDGKSVQGLSLEQSIVRLRGPIKTPVTLTIERAGRPEPIRVNLIRETIKVIPVKGRLEDNVAYIKISTFSGQTHPTLLSTVADLKKAAGDRLNGYVLDLRNNSGGLLDSATTTADDFLETGTIFSAKGRRPEATVIEHAKPGDIAEGKPIIILANGGTASGAEIVVAALQENKRATVIGTRTSGNGTIQTVFPLGERGAVRVTTSRFSTPNGRELETIGVAPDVVIEKEGSGAGRDAQLEAALGRLRSGDGK
jgi:carboxyl-terminal processing protease